MHFIVAYLDVFNYTHVAVCVCHVELKGYTYLLTTNICTYGYVSAYFVSASLTYLFARWKVC